MSVKNPTMSRQHFELIARVLTNRMPDGDIVADFADALEKTNPNFDRTRFVIAANKAD